MRPRELRGDSRIADMLWRDERPWPTETVGPLARRIVLAARPLLDGRRAPPATWWEYAAGWARTIIPLGVTVAVIAASGMMWVSVRHPLYPPAPPESQALLGAVTNEVSQPELVDFALSTSRWRGSAVVSGGSSPIR